MPVLPRLFAGIGHTIGDSLEVLHRIEWSAPWAATPKKRRAGALSRLEERGLARTALLAYSAPLLPALGVTLAHGSTPPDL